MLKSANAVDLRVEQATAKEMSAIGTKRTSLLHRTCPLLGVKRT